MQTATPTAVMNALTGHLVALFALLVMVASRFVDALGGHDGPAHAPRVVGSTG